MRFTNNHKKQELWLKDPVNLQNQRQMEIKP